MQRMLAPFAPGRSGPALAAIARTGNSPARFRDASGFSELAMQASIPVSDIILAGAPPITEEDPLAAIIPRVKAPAFKFKLFKSDGSVLFIVDAERGEGVPIGIGRLSQDSEDFQLRWFAWGFPVDRRYNQLQMLTPFDRQLQATEGARYVTTRSAAYMLRWTRVADLTPGVTYRDPIRDRVGVEWNVSGEMDTDIEDGALELRDIVGVDKSELSLALFGKASQAAFGDPRLREQRAHTDGGSRYPTVDVIKNYLGVKEVKIIPNALGVLEEPKPGTDPVVENLLPDGLAVLYYNGTPSSVLRPQGERFWSRTFELGPAHALQPIPEDRRTSDIYAWETCEETMFQPSFAIAYTNVYAAP